MYSNGYEEYSHTTCGSSCDDNLEDACLDDGNNGVGGGVAEEEAKICGTYAFTSSGNSLTTEIRNLGMTAVKKSFTQPQMIPIELGPMCFNFSADLISSASASNIINEAFNRTTNEIQQGLNNGTINATNIYVEFKSLVSD